MRPGFPLPDTDDALTGPYFGAAAESRLSLPRCAGCRRLVWYPSPTCRRCGAADMTWVDVEGRGRLFSWVVVRHAFLPQFADRVPFVTGLVALDEDPSVRLPTLVVDAQADTLAFDQPMEATFRPLSFTGVDGEVIVPLWKPVRPK